LSPILHSSLKVSDVTYITSLGHVRTLSIAPVLPNYNVSKMDEVKENSTPLRPFKELVSKSGSLEYENESMFDSLGN
jgi:hypothetical protein